MKRNILILELLLISQSNIFADIIVKGRARVSQGDGGDTEVRCRGRRGECIRISDAAAIIKVEVYTENGVEFSTCSKFNVSENGATSEDEFETVVNLFK